MNDSTITGQFLIERETYTGDLHISDGRIRDLQLERSEIDPTTSLWIAGLVDIHCHGGGGMTFSEPAQCAAAAAFHHERGTTTLLASLVSAIPDELSSSCAALGRLTQSGTIAGIHLEGPFLSASYCGAHDPTTLRAPDTNLLADLVDASNGSIVMVTFAPELDGALEAISWCKEHGILAAVGHTAATAERTRAALTAGATVATHICNAMPSTHHRRPGPVPVLLTDDRVACEIILDGEHISPETACLVLSAAGPARITAISDAIAATGMGDGETMLGNVEVVVQDGRATLKGTQTLAGSTITAADSFAEAIDLGWSVENVNEIHTTTPRRILGLEPAFALGSAADLVRLDPSCRKVEAVVRAGDWLRGRTGNGN